LAYQHLELYLDHVQPREEFAELAIRRIGSAERGGVSRRISERFWTGA
jgi:hypothetical protein